jgi:type I restriction enzyme, S subunit
MHRPDFDHDFGAKRMSLPRYPEYKVSGVEWLGEVPGHWDVVPFYSVAKEREEPNKGMVEDNLLSLSYGRIVQKDISANDGLLPESFETYQVVRQGDIVFRLTDLQNDKRSLRTAIVEETGIITSAYLAAMPFGIVPRYLNHLLRAYDRLKVFYSMGGGLRQSMKFSDVKRLPTLSPPLAEQQAIATFLDRETGKIDALIAEQQRLVELLAEKRQAVISHAVTKGLNPNAPVKDSGIEWLGEVPKHWGCMPMKYLVQLRSGGTPSKERRDYWDGSIPWASGKDMKVETLSDTEDHITELAVEQGVATLIEQNSVLVVVRGMILARTFPVALTDKKMAINQDLKAVIAGAKLQPAFLAWYLRGTADESLRRLDEAAHGTKALRMEAWTSMDIALPPLSEQADIANFLGRTTSQLDTLTTEANRAIALLKERRSALISAAVTGKIDVRRQA